MLDISAISDVTAEAGVIATLMYHPEFILHTDYLKAGYFYGVENGCIYWAISELYKSGIDNIDAINLTNMLNSNAAVKKKIAEYNINSMQEFIDMAQYAARHTLEEYKLLVNSVVTMSYKRDMNKVTHEIQSVCFDSEADLAKLNSVVNERINRVTEKYIISQDIEMFGSKVKSLWQEICDRRTSTGIYGLPSKFEILNNYFSYEPTEVVLISGRQKAGKSAFALNEATHKLLSGVPTSVFDTELADRTYFERMLANLTGIPVRSIKTGRYTYEEGKLLAKTNEWLEKQPFVHMYIPHHDNNEIYAICKILKYKMDLQYVQWDYIKDNTASSSEQYNLLGAKTDWLKNQIAGELNLAVLAGAQLNRNNLLADSDKIGRYVSTGLIWRPKTSEEIARDGVECGNYALTVNLNRNGQMMSDDEYIDMNFYGDAMQISVAKQHNTDNNNPFGEDTNEV